MTTILLTGATGFIGGSVLNNLVQSDHPAVRAATITAVVRKQDQLDRLQQHGLQGALFGGFDDTDRLRELASQSDVVIHAAFGSHTASAEALVLGLADRSRATGKRVDYIHLTGTSNLSYGYFFHEGLEVREFSDARQEEIFPEEERRNAEQEYAQRTTDITVIKTAEANGVRAYLMMPPTVYGRGTGLFKTQSSQLPFSVQHALVRGRAECIGDGLGGVGYVHVRDLSSLFELMTGKILEGDSLPYGREGYYFSNTGEYTWKDVTKRIGEIGVELDVLKSASPGSVTLDEAVDLWGWPIPKHAMELNFAARSKTKAVLAYELGWQPTGTEEDWNAGIRETFEAVLAEKKAP